MTEKRCQVCGDDLEGLDYGGGTVWTCDVHGVRDWHFEQGAHWLSPPGRGAARPPAPGELPAERATGELKG